MSDYETILYEKAGPAATITLNRPEARNGIVPQMMDDLWAAVQDAAADKSLRVLVLRGAGPRLLPRRRPEGLRRPARARPGRRPSASASSCTRRRW